MVGGRGDDGDPPSLPGDQSFAFYALPPVDVDYADNALIIGDDSISDGSVDIHLDEPDIITTVPDPTVGIDHPNRPLAVPPRPSIIAMMDWKPATMVDADTDKKIDSALGFTQPVKELIDLRFKQSQVRIQTAVECIKKMESFPEVSQTLSGLRQDLKAQQLHIDDMLKRHIVLWNHMQRCKFRLLFSRYMKSAEDDSFNNVFYSKYVLDGEAGFYTQTEVHQFGHSGPDSPTPFIYGNIALSPTLHNFLAIMSGYDASVNTYEKFSSTKLYAKIVEEL